MKYTNRDIVTLLVTGILLYAACVMLLWQRDLLFAAQDMSVWQSTSEFFTGYIKRPLGLLQYAALALTQLFYFPVLGIVVLTLLWTAATAMTSFAFRWQGKAMLMAVLPVPCLLAGITQNGYWIYMLKLPSLWLLPTLLWLWWSVALLIMLRGRNWVNRAELMVVWLLVLTPWNGFMLYAYDQSDNFMHIAYYVLAAVLLAQLATRWIPRWLPVVIVAVLVVAGSMMNYRNECFLAELRMQQEAEQGQWQTMVDEVASCKRTPTRQMVLLRDMALLHMGQLADTASYTCDGVRPEMLHGPQIHMAFTGGPILYYTSGYVNDAYRWLMENGVEYGFSPRRLRMMLRCALVNHEWKLARKYVRLLRLTWFNGSFADEMEPLIGHPELFANHPELACIARICQHEDILTPTNNYPERLIMSHPYSPLYNHRSWHFQGQTAVKLY